MRRSPSRPRCFGSLLALLLGATLAMAPAHGQSQGAATAKPAPAKAAKGTSKAAAAPAPAPAPAPAQQDQGSQFGDGIAAVVNKEIITMRELREASQRTANDLRQHKIQVPPDDVLQRQVLQQLIMDHLEEQEARRLGINVTDAQVDQAIGMIAERNKLNVAQMRAEIAKAGVSWDDYRKSIRDEIRNSRLRQRAVDNNVVVTDADVDAFLKEQSRGGGAPAQPLAAAPAPAPAPEPAAAAVPTNGPVALAQILVRVPEGASPEVVDRLRKKAEDLLARARKGEDFASLAAAACWRPARP